MRIKFNGQTLEQVVRYLGSIISCDAMCTEDIRDRKLIAKVGIKDEKDEESTSKLRIRFKRKSVKVLLRLEHRAVYGAETWPLKEIGYEIPGESFEMCALRRIKKTRWIDLGTK